MVQKSGESPVDMVNRCEYSHSFTGVSYMLVVVLWGFFFRSRVKSIRARAGA